MFFAFAFTRNTLTHFVKVRDTIYSTLYRLGTSDVDDTAPHLDERRVFELHLLAKVLGQRVLRVEDLQQAGAGYHDGPRAGAYTRPLFGLW